MITTIMLLFFIVNSGLWLCLWWRRGLVIKDWRLALESQCRISKQAHSDLRDAARQLTKLDAQ